MNLKYFISCTYLNCVEMQDIFTSNNIFKQKSSQHNRADLEAELTRLQSVLDELANHRQEINNSVEKLKSEAGGSKGSEVRASPTGVAGNFPFFYSYFKGISHYSLIAW